MAAKTINYNKKREQSMVTKMSILREICMILISTGSKIIHNEGSIGQQAFS